MDGFREEAFNDKQEMRGLNPHILLFLPMLFFAGQQVKNILTPHRLRKGWQGFRSATSQLKSGLPGHLITELFGHGKEQVFDTVNIFEKGFTAAGFKRGLAQLIQ